MTLIKAANTPELSITGSIKDTIFHEASEITQFRAIPQRGIIFNVQNHYIHQNCLINKLINKFVKHGNTPKVHNLILQAFGMVKKSTDTDPVAIILKSLSTLRSTVGMLKYYTRRQARKKKRKKGFLIPVPLHISKQLPLALN